MGTLLSNTFVGTLLLGGQFQSSIREVTRSQQQLNLVRCLASASSRAVHGSLAPRASQQSQKGRAALSPPPPSALQVATSGERGSPVSKHRWSKNSGSRGLATPSSASGSAGWGGGGGAGGRGPLIRGLPMVAAEGSPPSPPPISPTMVEEVGGSPYLELLDHVWNYQLGLAKIGPFPVGSRLSFFLPGCMETDYLRPVCLPDGQAGVVFSFCEESTFGARCCRSTITLPAVQIGSFVARGFIPPAQGGHGACRDVVGPGRDLLILVLATKRTGSDPFSISEDSTHFFVFEVPYGDPPLYSAWSSQRLVDGVAGSQGRLSACSNPPSYWWYLRFALRNLAGELIVYHCLSKFSLPQSFYQTPGPFSGPPASAGMSHTAMRSSMLRCPPTRRTH